jgi:hypothetical protein
LSPSRRRTVAVLPIITALLLGSTEASAQSSGSLPEGSQPPDLETRTSEGLVPGQEGGTSTGVPLPEAPAEPPKDTGPLVDGHPRSGPFLSGPGSLPFVLHHTLMGAAGGLVTQGIAHRFSLESGPREAMLVGTLVGAALSFGISAWWQFNNWIGAPMGNFGIVHSLITGMFLVGMVDLVSNDSTALAYTALIGAELGAWVTALAIGGEMSLGTGLAVSSGAGWAMAYMALLLATINNSGTHVGWSAIVDSLLIAPGVGAGLAALASLRFHPTATQVLRADILGAGVGAVVLALSAAVLGGFGSPTPYVLSLLSSAVAIAVVSIFWAESAERPATVLYRSPEKDRPYRTVWW